MKKSNKYFSIFSKFQAYDFRSDVGLIVAYEVGVELTTDYGQTKTNLGSEPSGFMWFGCVVIVNQTTIFLAGISDNNQGK